MNFFQFLSLLKTENLIKHLFATGIIFFIAFISKIIIFRMLRIAIKQFENGDPETTSALKARGQTLEKLAQDIINVSVFSIAILIILSEWGINITPILTGAGILGLAVGFGTQTLVKDVVTGFFILLENQFNVEDTVKIAGVKGKVVEIKLRTTVLKGKDGETYVIPNSKIAEVTKYKDESS